MSSTKSKLEQGNVMNKNFISKHIIGILLLANLSINTLAIADESSSISQGQFSKHLTTESRQAIVKESKSAVTIDQTISRATGKTRAEMLNNKTKKSSKLALPIQDKSHSHLADFAIYGASTLLQDDYDGDGYYQTFSVSFDADIYSYTPNQIGEVYALLYISKNGGPWLHYYTTDNFLIESDYDNDEYEVITTFLSGYSGDHYDILIDLYQVGYSDIVASYSADDSNALYALSLESADYDEPYIEVIEVVEVSHGGSLSMAILLFFLFIYLLRRANYNN